MLSPILSQEDATGEWERIKELIARNGKAVAHEERWGMRRLAYPIRKAGQTFLEGNYLLTRFSTDTVVPRELEGHLRLAENVLRYLLIKAGPPESAPPSPQMVQLARAAEAQRRSAAAQAQAAPAAAPDASVAAAAPVTADVSVSPEAPEAGLAHTPVAEEPVAEEIEAASSETVVAEARVVQDEPPGGHPVLTLQRGAEDTVERKGQSEESRQAGE